MNLWLKKKSSDIMNGKYDPPSSILAKGNIIKFRRNIENTIQQ